MTRDDFIAGLRRGLAGLPPESVDDIIADYQAHFADGLAAGRTEDQVAEALGDPERLARELRAAAGAGAASWDDGRWSWSSRARGSRGYWRGMRSLGVHGWLGVILAILVLILVLPVILTVVGTILGVVLAGAVVMAIVAALFGGLFYWTGWGGRWGRSFRSPVDATGPRTSRAFAWTGGDTLSVAVPAEVEFSQSPDVALSITGPSGALDHIVVEGGEIRYDRWVRNAGRLRIVLSAPDVMRFAVMGSVDVKIAGYRQERLKIRIAGRGNVIAEGEARTAEIVIAGKGDVDLGKVAGEQVKVEIAGSGAAIVAPTRAVEVGIAGSGVVTLLTNPPTVRTRIAGSGRIVHAAPSAA
ncbi:MAG: GIN domain-containing protein [Caulobacterales bacterium]